MTFAVILRSIILLIFIRSSITSKHRTCGKRTVDENRIYDGQEAVRGSHPWLVSLEQYEYGKWVHKCGGTILKKRWIVTAAHCFINFNKFPMALDTEVATWRVVAGDHDKTVKEPTEQIVVPDIIILHEEFTLASEYNSPADIAMLRLSTPLKVQGQWVREACRPDPDTKFDDHTHCQVAGWGHVDGRSHTPDSDSRLQYYNSTILPTSECNQTAQAHDRRVLDTMICLRTDYIPEERRGTGGVCKGDSGSTLLCRVDENYFIAGIVSWSIHYNCGRTHDVFTRYQSYAQWVNAIMGQS